MSTKVWAWIVGASVVAFAFRNPMQQIGLIVGAIACTNILIHYGFQKKLSLGSKFIWIPLLIVILSIIGSCLVRYTHNHDSSQLFGNVFMAVYFFAVYVVARLLGKDVFKPFAWAVLIEAVSIIIYGLIHLGTPNGGLASVLNYNLAIGILVFGTIVSAFYKKWYIALIVLVALFFTSPEEAFIGLFILGLAFIIRHDWNKKVLVAIGGLALIVVLGIFPFSYTKSLYERPLNRLLYYVDNKQAVASYYQPPQNATTFEKMDYLLDGRLTFIKKAFSQFHPLGTGYILYPDIVRDSPIHNAPLIIVQQVGILGALAWTFLIIYGIVKTKWKYAFIAVIALSILDNFFWSQIGLWIFLLAGVASVNDLETDLVFRRA